MITVLRHESWENGDRKVVAAARELVRMAVVESANPQIRQLALAITAGLDTRDRLEVARRMREFMRNNVTYTHDPAAFEDLDAPTEVLRSLRGDCDASALQLALLYAVGQDARLIAWSPAPGAPLQHVFVESGDGVGTWYPMDWTTDPSFAAHLATGRRVVVGPDFRDAQLAGAIVVHAPAGLVAQAGDAGLGVGDFVNELRATQPAPVPADAADEAAFRAGVEHFVALGGDVLPALTEAVREAMGHTRDVVIEATVVWQLLTEAARNPATFKGNLGAMNALLDLHPAARWLREFDAWLTGNRPDTWNDAVVDLAVVPATAVVKMLETAAKAAIKRPDVWTVVGLAAAAAATAATVKGLLAGLRRRVARRVA